MANLAYPFFGSLIWKDREISISTFPEITQVMSRSSKGFTQNSRKILVPWRIFVKGSYFFCLEFGKKHSKRSQCKVIVSFICHMIAK